MDAAPLVVVVVFREARSDRMRGESKTDKKKNLGQSWKEQKRRERKRTLLKSPTRFDSGCKRGVRCAREFERIWK